MVYKRRIELTEELIASGSIENPEEHVLRLLLSKAMTDAPIGLLQRIARLTILDPNSEASKSLLNNPRVPDHVKAEILHYKNLKKIRYEITIP